MIKHLFNDIMTWLQSLSFRTGVIVLLCCIPFYILSFAQMLLPTSAAAKGVLWTILFGLAKTCQYGGLTILGVEGFNRLKNGIKRRKGYEQKHQEGIADRHGIYYAGHGGCQGNHAGIGQYAPMD